MKALYDLKDKLCVELDEIAAKSSMSTGDLETLHKLTDTIKNIDKIIKLESESGYSSAGGWEARGTYGHPYDDSGSSYMRHGEHYIRGHYSRDDARQHMINKLQDMLRTADGKYREVIQRALDEIHHG
jgi:hypothetical protein